MRNLFVVLFVTFLALPVGTAAAQTYDSGLAAFEAGNAKRAEEIWTPLALSGDPLSKYGLGKLYDSGGPGIAPDPVRAVQWYQKAVEDRVLPAYNNLAMLYAEGRGVTRDPAKAAEYWRRAAESGQAQAQYNLALAYYRGFGVENDLSQAALWFRRAADAELPEAQFALAEMSRHGIGVPENQGLALYWYQQAAAGGNQPSLENVTKLLADGGKAQKPPPLAAAPALMTAANRQTAVPSGGAASVARPIVPPPPAQAPVAEAPVAPTAARPTTLPSTSLVGRVVTSPSMAVAAPPQSASGSLQTTASDVVANGAQPTVAPAGTLSAGRAAGVGAPAGPMPSLPERRPATVPATASSMTASSGSAAPPTPAAAPRLIEPPTAPAMNSPPAPRERPPQVAAVPAPVTRGAANPQYGIWVGSMHSLDGAERLWAEVAGRFPDLTAGLTLVRPEIETAKGTFHRAVGVGWATRAEAEAVCRAMEARRSQQFCRPVPL